MSTTRPGSRPPSTARRFGRDLRRAVSWHRRALAALAAALAVLVGVSAALPEPPARTEVLVIRSGLSGGHVLDDGDLRRRAMAADDVPTEALTDLPQAVGQTLVAPMSAGEVLTGTALTSARARSSPGRVVLPLRLADAAVVTLLQPGDVVDVLGTDEAAGLAHVVAADVRVVTVPAADDDSGSGALVLVETTAAGALALAAAVAAGPLTVTWR